MTADWITQGLYDYLAGNAVVQGLVSTYDGRPAIFVGETVPESAQFPFVWVQPPSSDVAVDSKTTRARLRRYMIGVYNDADGSTVALDDAAERLRGELHRASIVSAEGAFVVVAADIVGAAPTSEQVSGRLLQVSVRFAER